VGTFVGRIIIPSLPVRSKLDLRDFPFPSGLYLEKGLELKAKQAGKDVTGEDFDAVLILQGRIVVKLAREPDLVFGRSQFFLQSLEILICLQVRVCLGHSQEGSQGLGQSVFGLGPLLDAAGGADRLLAGFGDRLQRSPLVSHVTLDRFDQIGDEVVPPLKLDIDLTPGVLDRVAGPHQPIVERDQINRECDDDPEDNE